MMTVSISINGNVIAARSAMNTSETKGNMTKYEVDDGSIIWHNPKDGAVVLSKKLLDTIVELKKYGR